MKIFVLILFVVMLPVQVSAEIFKWTDKSGQVHYDDKPPQQNQSSKQLVEINEQSNAVTGLSDDRNAKRKKLLDAIDEDRQLKKDEAAKEKKKRTRLIKQCLYARDKLKRYQRSSYVYGLDSDGNRVVSPPGVREKIITKLQNEIEMACVK